MKQPKELLPGQIWVDKNHVYHPTDCGDWPIILLSSDKYGSDDEDFWRVAEFQAWQLGMYLRLYTEIEIRKLEYAGNINELKECKDE